MVKVRRSGGKIYLKWSEVVLELKLLSFDAKLKYTVVCRPNILS